MSNTVNKTVNKKANKPYKNKIPGQEPQYPDPQPQYPGQQPQYSTERLIQQILHPQQQEQQEQEQKNETPAEEKKEKKEGGRRRTTRHNIANINVLINQNEDTDGNIIPYTTLSHVFFIGI